ncbi:MAG: hypothetical protein GX957_06135 [Clostridiaceae bacterium]|nr:hypothetical protein [Clostridiaceae bacterium]
MNAYRYIAVNAVCFTVRRSRRAHYTKNKGMEKSRKKDKPPSRTPNRNAKFALKFSRGKFGLFYYASKIRNHGKKARCSNCRDPPSINRFGKIKID